MLFPLAGRSSFAPTIDDGLRRRPPRHCEPIPIPAHRFDGVDPIVWIELGKLSEAIGVLKEGLRLRGSSDRQLSPRRSTVESGLLPVLDE
jgi:hypothetical protein